MRAQQIDCLIQYRLLPQLEIYQSVNSFVCTIKIQCICSKLLLATRKCGQVFAFLLCALKNIHVNITTNNI